MSYHLITLFKGSC